MRRGFRLSWLLPAIAVLVVTPASADSYLIYTEGGIPLSPAPDRTTELWTWCDQGQPCATQLEVCGSPEGITTLRADGNEWSGLGFFLNVDGNAMPPVAGSPPVDLSAFANADLRFHVKAPDSGIGDFNVKVEIQCNPSGTVETRTLSIADHGWDGTSAWQELSIPLTAFFDPDPVDPACLASMVSPFMITIETLPFFNSFLVDNVRWQVPNSHAGASSVQIQGRQLIVNGEPFVVDGLAYAPISIGQNWQGAWTDRPDRYLVDFPQIAESGANTVRMYAPLVSTAMLDEAWAEGLHVIPTFGVSTGQLTCPAGRDSMRERFVETVNEWKNHPAILMWLVGNEVNAELGTADLCLDWYTQLDSLAAAAHEAEGESFHPVGTASAEVDDICVAGCSDDITLPNVDFWATQLYRGCSFTTAFTEYSQNANCDRPLLVTEFGADAYNSMLDAESETLQADCLDSLLDEADEALAVRTPGGVSSGQVVFEWIDEWWKADDVCGTGWEVHDGCTNFSNFAYPDPGINEEWWGIVGQDSADPDARLPRTAFTNVSESWNLGNVCNLAVETFDAISGNTGISFDPAPGSTDHTLYYGPLSAVSSYGYSGTVTALGASGSASLTLPPGSLFWLVVGRDNAAEGGYGTGGGERPASPGAAIPQAPNRTGLCSGL